jgi:hypothetical protein
MWLRTGISLKSCKNGDEIFSSTSGGEFLDRLMTVTFKKWFGYMLYQWSIISHPQFLRKHF